MKKISEKVIQAQLDPEFPTSEMERAYKELIQTANALDISLNEYQHPKIWHITQTN